MPKTTTKKASTKKASNKQNDVEKLESWSGNASLPIWFVVTFGYSIFNGIIYSSW